MVISYDLAITKSSVRDEINNSIRYTLTVNNSVVEAPSVVISDTIPNGISAFAWTCTGISCPNATGTGSISESIGAFPAGATVTYNITATMIISTATITNTATVSASNEVNNSNNTAINVSQPFFNIYLPVTLKKAIFAPDLIITSLTANTNDVTVVIQNQGNAAVTDAFWVDVYYTTSAPVLNQLGDVYWGLSVDNGGVPIAVGGTVTLTLSSPYYGGGIPPSAANTTLYGQVDSIGLFSYGAVLESNESNNVFGPTSSTTALGKVSPARQSLLDISGLPTRR
ncbi:MAG: hypothetical protein KDJ65_11490 [Anaerolineae bacterium]|nr:hypothetical protein [Anaerolineae bacterium]